MNLDQVITVSENVLAQEISGEMVLLDLNSDQYMGLNEVGARVWQLLEKSKDLKMIFEQLLEEYEIEASILETDLVQLMLDMRKAKIVSFVPNNV